MLDTVQFSSSIEEREEEEGTFVLHVLPSPVSLTSNQLKNFIGLLPLSQHIFLLPPLFLSNKSWDHLVLFVVSFIQHPFCRCLSAKPSLPATPSLFSFCPLYCCASLPLSSLFLFGCSPSPSLPLSSVPTSLWKLGLGGGERGKRLKIWCMCREYKRQYCLFLLPLLTAQSVTALVIKCPTSYITLKITITGTAFFCIHNSASVAIDERE